MPKAKRTSQRLKCSVCQHRTTYAYDPRLEETGVCTNCTRRAKEA